MGTLKEIVDLDLAQRHVCLLRAENVEIDFEKKTVSVQKKNNNTGQPQPVAGCSKYDAVAHISQDSGEDLLCSFNDYTSDNNNFGNETQISKPQADHLKVQVLANVTPETQWSEGSIMLLITTYKDLKEKFNSPLYNKKKV